MSSSRDGILRLLIKEAAPIIYNSLTVMFNKSIIECSVFPSRLKQAKVIANRKAYERLI